MNNPKYLTDSELENIWNYAMTRRWQDATAETAERVIANAASDKAYQEGLAEAESKVKDALAQARQEMGKEIVEWLDDFGYIKQDEPYVMRELRAWLERGQDGTNGE